VDEVEKEVGVQGEDVAAASEASNGDHGGSGEYDTDEDEQAETNAEDVAVGEKGAGQSSGSKPAPAAAKAEAIEAAAAQMVATPPILLGWWTPLYAVAIVYVGDGSFLKAAALLLLGCVEAYMLWVAFTAQQAGESGRGSGASHEGDVPKTRERKMSRPNPLYGHVANGSGSVQSAGARTRKDSIDGAAAAAALDSQGGGVALLTRKVSSGAVNLLGSAKKGQAKSRLLRTSMKAKGAMATQPKESAGALPPPPLQPQNAPPQKVHQRRMSYNI
jgi:hypothetical protein